MTTKLEMASSFEIMMILKRISKLPVNLQQ